MPNYDLGTAHGTIKIDYDKRGFAMARKDIQGLSDDSEETGRALDSLQKKFASLGTIVRKGFGGSPKVVLEADVDTKKAQAKIKALGGDSETVNVPVDVDTVKANASMGIFRARQSAQEVHVNVNIDRNMILQGMTVVGRAIGSMMANVNSVVASGFRAVGQAGVSAFSSVAESVGSFAGSMGSVLPLIGKGLAMLVAFEAVSSLIAVAGGAIYVAWGGIATAIMAVPAAIALIGAPIAAVMLGMDGIKAAAETLKPAFEEMKTAVSQTFAQGLKPVFESLKSVFPTIQEGMQGVAVELITMATSLTKVVQNADRLGVLDQIFTNLRNGLLQSGLAADHLLGAFLRLASNTAAMDAIVEPFKHFAIEFDKMVAKLDDSGVLTTAFEGLEDVLKSCVDLMIELVSSGIETFAAAAPGLKTFLDGITDFISKVDTNALGTAMGDMFAGIGEILKGIPKESIDSIVTGLQQLADVVKDPAFQTMIQDIFALIGPAIGDFADIIGGAAGAWAAFKTFVDWLQATKAPAWMESFFKSAGMWMGSDTAPAVERSPDEDNTSWTEGLTDAPQGKVGGQTKIIPKGGAEVGGGPIEPGADPAQLQAVQAAAAAAQAAVTALGAAIAAVVLQATTGFGSIGLSITTSLTGAGTSVTTFAATIATAFGTAFLGATTAVTTGMLGITLAISTGLIGITAAVTVGMAGLGIAITGALALAFVGAAVAATTGFIGLGIAFTTGILGLGVAITVGLAGLGIAITAGIGLMFVGAALAVTTGFIGIGAAFTVGITGLGITIGAGFVGLGVAIVAAIAGAFVGSAAAVAAGFVTVGAAVATGVAAVTLAIKALGPAIKIAFDLAFAGLAAGVKTGMDAAVAAVKAGVTAISTEIAKVGTIVGDAVKAEDWPAVGQAICDGILKGVQAGWPKLEQAVKQLAASLFAAAMQGIQAGSPSKLFALVGKFMMQGWLKGIVKYASILLKAVGGIILKVMEMFGWGGGGGNTPPPPPPPPVEPSTGWGWNPKARPTGASWKQDEFLKGPINITIDAQTVAEMNGVVDFFNTVQQTARAGRSN